MKNLLFVFCSLLLFFNPSYAQGKIRLAIGPTISYFLNTEDTRPKVGISIGIVKDFHLYNKFLLSAGIGFASRGAILENRTIAPYASQPKDAFYQNIHCMLGYIEIPTTIQYEISDLKKIKFKPFIGPIFTFPVVDLTHFEKMKFFNVYTPGQSNILDYDFWFEQESVFRNNITKVGFTFGLRISYKKYNIELYYVLDNRDVFYFNNLSEIHKKMNSIYFLISF